MKVTLSNGDQFYVQWQHLKTPEDIQAYLKHSDAVHYSSSDEFGLITRCYIKTVTKQDDTDVYTPFSEGHAICRKEDFYRYEKPSADLSYDRRGRAVITLTEEKGIAIGYQVLRRKGRKLAMENAIYRAAFTKQDIASFFEEFHRLWPPQSGDLVTALVWENRRLKAELEILKKREAMRQSAKKEQAAAISLR